MTIELRRYLRTSTEYLVEYGPFPLTGRAEDYISSVITNIGAGGLLFQARGQLPIGRQLALKIHVPGWIEKGEDIVEAEDDSVAVISAIAEVKRCDFNHQSGQWDIGVKFLGRILS